MDEDLVQIVRMEHRDGNVVKRVKPALIKKEISQEYVSVLPFEDDDAPLFTDTERVPFHKKPRGPYDKEVTD